MRTTGIQNMLPVAADVLQDDRSAAVFSERAAWQSVPAGWKQLAGSFTRLGFSVEWHNFASPRPLNWGASFHPDAVEICLNLAGNGRVRTDASQVDVAPQTSVFYYSGGDPLRASRAANEPHQFVTVELSRAFIERQFPSAEALHPVVRQRSNIAPGASAVGMARALTTRQQQLVTSFRQPPVGAAAQPVWFLGKVLELCAELFFDHEEFFCERQKRVAQGRVQRVTAILSSNLAEPPDLAELGRQVGCSPFYLSRTFSQEMGITIPQFIRKLRMERAAELLRTGRYNVTEVALEVGYSSLSHFSQAFCQTIGCCPNLYPHALTAQRKQR